jgi:hypothetical protein
MEAIEAELVLNPEQDQEGAGHPDGQAGDVDGRIAFVSPDVPERDLQVVFKHFQPPKDDIFQIVTP